MSLGEYHGQVPHSKGSPGRKYTTIGNCSTRQERSTSRRPIKAIEVVQFPCGKTRRERNTNGTLEQTGMTGQKQPFQGFETRVPSSIKNHEQYHQQEPPLKTHSRNKPEFTNRDGTRNTRHLMQRKDEIHYNDRAYRKTGQ